jgi:hypothetical protein
VTAPDSEWAIRQLRRRRQVECRVSSLAMSAAAWCDAVDRAAVRAGVNVVTHIVPPDAEVGTSRREQLVIAVLVDSTVVETGEDRSGSDDRSTGDGGGG